jgi:hypothetical protein
MCRVKKNDCCSMLEGQLEHGVEVLLVGLQRPGDDWDSSCYCLLCMQCLAVFDWLLY